VDQGLRLPRSVRFIPSSYLHSLTAFSLFLEATAATYAFSTTEGDLPASIAIAWSLFAIFAHQTLDRSPFVHWASLVFAILALVWVIKGAFGLFSKLCSDGHLRLEDEERAPLTGN
jgi:hypothetical protein